MPDRSVTNSVVSRNDWMLTLFSGDRKLSINTPADIPSRKKNIAVIIIGRLWNINHMAPLCRFVFIFYSAVTVLSAL
jgi:hypothetical protein